jgi:isopenicillin N synthase-like dioxygenase
MSLPIVDLSLFANGDKDERQRIAREIDAICRDVGFLGVVGHGVPDKIVSELYAASKDFFRKSFDQKCRVQQPRSHVVRGYIGLAKGALGALRGESTPPDLKESFTVGPEAGEEDTVRSPVNLWPEGDSSFRAAWLAYYAEMARLSRDLMRLFASALTLETDHFDDVFDRHSSVLSAIHYPNQTSPPVKGQLRAGAHTDFDVLTLLRPDDAPGGLEVMTEHGIWMPVRAPADGFVVNIGEMMARWTNDRWKSTLHRVVNPPRDRTGSTERLSIGFFLQPADDFVIACLPSCCDASEGPRYAPISAGDYVNARFASQIVGNNVRS